VYRAGLSPDWIGGMMLHPVGVRGGFGGFIYSPGKTRGLDVGPRWGP